MVLLANQERQVQLVPKVAMEYQGLLVLRESKVKKASKACKACKGLQELMAYM